MRAYDFRLSFGDHRLFCVGPSCVLISTNSSINHSIHCSFSSADGLYRSNDPFDSWRAATTLLEGVTYHWANFEIPSSCKCQTRVIFYFTLIESVLNCCHLLLQVKWAAIVIPLLRIAA